MGTKEFSHLMLDKFKHLRDTNQVGSLRQYARGNCEDDPADVTRLLNRKAEKYHTLALIERQKEKRKKQLHFAARVHNHIRKHGKLHVKVWTKTCEHFEKTYLRTFDSHDDFFKWYSDNPGGVMGLKVTLLTPEEVDRFESEEFHGDIHQTYEQGDPGTPIYPNTIDM
jgi:hypothetical protein